MVVFSAGHDSPRTAELRHTRPIVPLEFPPATIVFRHACKLGARRDRVEAEGFDFNPLGGYSKNPRAIEVAARAAVAELVSCNCELYPIFCQHVRRRHKLVIQRLRDRGNRR